MTMNSIESLLGMIATEASEEYFKNRYERSKTENKSKEDEQSFPILRYDLELIQDQNDLYWVE